MAESRARLLEDLQAPQLLPSELRALTGRVEAWMAAHPQDLEVAGTAESVHTLLSAFDEGLEDDPEATIPPGSTSPA